MSEKDKNQEATISLLNSHYYQQRRIAGYHARNEIEFLKNKIPPGRLEHYGYKVYSQNDEDGIIEEIFNRIGVSKGVFCEIGVENGLECNSLYLLHKGWRGVWIEANENYCTAIKSKFSTLLNRKRLVLASGYATPDNINQAIKESFNLLDASELDIDFLSIDIDGMDIYLLSSILLKPKVICIEYNGKFPAHVSKKPVFDPTFQWRGGDFMGSSLLAIEEAAEKKGYRLVGTNITGSNAFFVRHDLVNDDFNYELTSENLYNPCRYWLTFDLFSHCAGHPADFGSYVDLSEEL